MRHAGAVGIGYRQDATRIVGGDRGSRRRICRRGVDHLGVPCLLFWKKWKGRLTVASDAFFRIGCPFWDHEHSMTTKRGRPPLYPGNCEYRPKPRKSPETSSCPAASK